MTIAPPLKQITRAYHVISPHEFSALQLKKNLGRIVPIDSTWYMPNVKKNGFIEFQGKRIPNAVFFDIDQVKDHKNEFPHMLPSEVDFNNEVSKLGIVKDDNLVIYDKQGIFSCCRTSWMFEIFGHDLDKIYILNHYPLYLKQGGELDESSLNKPTSLQRSQYTSTGLQKSKVILFEELLQLVQSGDIKNYYLIDARSAPRFSGEQPEPRPGLPSGHIPGAINVPFGTLLFGQDNTIPSKQELVSHFKKLGINDDKPIIVMCGTGVTACIVKVCLDVAGLNKNGHIVYDGSWTEWAQRSN
ncbi:hypothetical protein PACTADRAFT_71316 [Pachysolen tannophilus NRRL Y-2460]|uniref:Rhodanese domain-containing protein n=1 Tax=Pachysolen tannophilus NRRL Y-2460 TaxID=669874 RepID=A0A1E4TP89_PACTA|nr:hypothetical protein PACTADRAFT_71316 [Pachysolen tannophilus NRRL Y-2460]